MSDKEFSRVEILRDLAAGRLTVSAASELMGLELRQVLRLSKAYQEYGATALISKKRGRASNRPHFDLVSRKTAFGGAHPWSLSSGPALETSIIFRGR